MATHSSILAWKIPQTEDPGTVHGVAKNQIQEYIHTHTHTHTHIHTREQSFIPKNHTSDASLSQGQNG